MVAHCPHCQLALEVPASGTYSCAQCSTRFRVAFGAPAPAGEAAGAAALLALPDPVVPGIHTPCSTHAGNAAAGTCERCGDFICALCATPAEGRVYCPRCFDLLYHRGALYFTHRSFTLPATTLILAVVALLCAVMPFFFCTPFLAVGLGFAGLVSGARALREYRERPDLPGRAQVAWGMGLSALSLVLAIVAGGFFFYALSR